MLKKISRGLVPDVEVLAFIIIAAVVLGVVADSMLVLGWFALGAVPAYALAVYQYNILVSKQHEVGEQLLISVYFTFLTKDIVDAKLCELAEEFKTICDEQVKFQNLDTAEGDVGTLNTRVKAAKRAFWDAAKLAETLGLEKPTTISGCLVKNYRPQKK